MKDVISSVLVACALLPGSALAQQTEVLADPFAVTGNVTAVSDYRLRGISLSDEEPAIQGGITVAHESGLYVGGWASSLAGYGTFGGANIEADALVGYTTAVGKAAVDGGLIWYFYPGTSGHDYGELYTSVSHPIGPVRAKLGANYAFDQDSIGDVDNLWVYGDLVLPLAGTPITLRGHLGYTDGEGSIFAGPRGHYLDYAAGADITWKQLTFGITYLGTDIDREEADVFFSVPGARPGGDIVDDALVVSLNAAF
jgi:uncharacterized protein (TIGR02001 family)